MWFKNSRSKIALCASKVRWINSNQVHVHKYLFWSKQTRANVLYRWHHAQQKKPVCHWHPTPSRLSFTTSCSTLGIIAKKSFATTRAASLIPKHFDTALTGLRKKKKKEKKPKTFLYFMTCFWQPRRTYRWIYNCVTVLMPLIWQVMIC